MIQIYLEKGRPCQMYSEKGGTGWCFLKPAMCLFMCWGFQWTKPVKFSPPISKLHGLGPSLTKALACFFYVFEHLSSEFRYSLVVTFLFVFVFHTYVKIFVNLCFHSHGHLKVSCQWPAIHTCPSRYTWMSVH